MSLKKSLKKKVPFWTCMSLCAVGCFCSCNDGYNLMDEDPAWLGSSIYDYLKNDGHYTNVVRMIDDLGYANVLAKTGSKTLFVADDDAFARFYTSRKWGVGRYEDLSVAQKKMLLYGAMINNACQVAYLSSSAGPVEGDCMRRMTSASAYDSVPYLKVEDMPGTPYWDYYRRNSKNIYCLSDKTVPPMIHFIEAFLQNREITNEDCNFLYNYEMQRKPGDANVNGVMMVEQNIRCANGFVHKMGEVMTPLPNMADLISTMPRTQLYAKLLNRFCAPYYDENTTKEFNALYGMTVDSVFQKRYFSERSQNGAPLILTPEEESVPAKLKFDPGWNAFYSEMSASTATNVALQENMGVMLVPTDEALTRYWEEGAGKVLKDKYGTWENVPDNVVAELLNVNMLNSFVNSVPSKFYSVLNDANDALGLSVDAVDSVFMACNGAVYMTNKVFNPVSYVSVSFPALVNESMNIMYWAIKELDYNIYLNSQNSYYSFFIPTNKALLEYVDPCSYGKESTQLFRFHYDASKQLDADKVWASIWKYDPVNEVVGDSIGEANYTQIINRLKDVLDNHIVVGNVEDGNTYYPTKGGNILRVENAGAGENGMKVMGGWQIEQGRSVPVSLVYDQSREGNGKSYILDGMPLLTSRKSVADILREHEEFSEFLGLLEGTPYLVNKYIIGTDEHGCPSENINLFNTFNYTVYVPTNESIRSLQKTGELPTWEQVEFEEDEEIRDSLANEINQFVKYHIQDNALYIGQKPVKKTNYETAAYVIDEKSNTLSYLKVEAELTSDGITIKDMADPENEKHVVKTGGLYNLMAREYQYGEADAMAASTLYTSSSAVVHLIDGALSWRKKSDE